MSPRVVILVVVGVIALAVVLAALMARQTDPGGAAAMMADVPAPRVDGSALAPYGPAGADGAVGQPAPDVQGAGFDGGPVSITNDGRPKVLLFLAHWCPHCQSEVPVVQAWVNGGGKPDGVDLYAIATAIDPSRPNYPPNAWLEREGWTSPVLVDTTDVVRRAYGIGGVPFWVFVNSDGTVAQRISGSVARHELTPIFEALR